MKPLSSDERYQELALKWLNNTITPEEKEAFAQWYNFAQDKNIILPENYVSDEKELEARIFSEIENRIVSTFVFESLVIKLSSCNKTLLDLEYKAITKHIMM